MWNRAVSNTMLNIRTKEYAKIENKEERKLIFIIGSAVALVLGFLSFSCIHQSLTRDRNHQALQQMSALRELLH